MARIRDRPGAGAEYDGRGDQEPAENIAARRGRVCVQNRSLSVKVRSGRRFWRRDLRGGIPGALAELLPHAHLRPVADCQTWSESALAIRTNRTIRPLPIPRRFWA